MGNLAIVVAVAGQWPVMMDRSIGMLSCRLAVKLALLVAGSMAIGESREQMQLEVLDIPGVSSPQWESHPAEDPLTHDLWFVRSDSRFEGWRIWVAHCENGRFADALPSPIGAPGLEADPAFVDGGTRLLFISTRSTGALRSADLDIWESTRTSAGWSAPARLPAPINSEQAEWFPRLASDGWLYFGSGRNGGQGKTDIWRARRSKGGVWRVENLGVGLNSSENEYELAIYPNGRDAILATDHGLFEAHERRGGWVRGARLGSTVNGNGTEIGPTALSSGSGFLFSRDLGGQKSGELMVDRRAGQSSSPLACLNGSNPEE